MPDESPKDQVLGLLPLQEVDFEVHRIRRQMEIKPRGLAETEAAVASNRRAVEAAKDEIKKLKVEASKFELEVKVKDDAIAKMEADALKAKKNEEYLMIQKQISGLRADKQVIEDRWLEYDFKIEHAAKRCRSAEEELKAAEARLVEEKSRVEGEMTVLGERLRSETEKRQGLSQGIEPDLLDKYQRVLNSRSTDGRALAKVMRHADLVERKGEPKKKKKSSEDEERFETFRYSCEGCQSELTFQDVNMLMKGREILTCRNCSRILYVSRQ